MKTVHRATTPKLQEAAQNASGAIRSFLDLLGDEIAKNSVEVPKKMAGIGGRGINGLKR